MTPAEAPATPADRILGLLGGAMVLLALVLLVRQCVAPGPEDGAPIVPTIRLVEAPAVAPGSGVVVTFSTDAPLEQGLAGWGADTLHLHADLDGRMVMSDAGRVEPLGEGRFRWTLPAAALPPGRPPLVLYWAGPSHRRVAGGATAPVLLPAR